MRFKSSRKLIKLTLSLSSSRKVIQTFYTPVVEYIIVRLTDVRFESSLTFPLIKLCTTFHKILLITKIVRINQFLKVQKNLNTIINSV